jgi:hypothetical protein
MSIEMGAELFKITPYLSKMFFKANFTNMRHLVLQYINKIFFSRKVADLLKKRLMRE